MKKIVLSIISIFIIGAVTCAYISINKRFPESKVIRTPKGETMEFQNDVWLSVEKKELLTQKESEELYRKVNDRRQMKRRILRVTFRLENRSSERKEIYLSDLNMEMEGFSNGIFSFPQQAGLEGTEGFDNVGQQLEAGESCQVMYSFDILEDALSKKQWEKLEEQDIWIACTAYPEKRILDLE